MSNFSLDGIFTKNNQIQAVACCLKKDLCFEDSSESQKYIAFCSVLDLLSGYQGASLQINFSKKDLFFAYSLPIPKTNASNETLYKLVNCSSDLFREAGYQLEPINPFMMLDYVNQLFNFSEQSKYSYYLQNQKSGIDITEIVDPKLVKDERVNLRVGDVCSRTIALCNLPHTDDFSFLNQILEVDESVDVAVHIKPIDKKNVLKNAQNIVSKFEGYKENATVSNVLLPYDVLGVVDEMTQISSDLQDIMEMTYFATFLVNVRSKNIDDIEQKVDKIINIASKASIRAFCTTDQHLEGIHSIIPLATSKIDIKQIFQTKQLQKLFLLR